MGWGEEHKPTPPSGTSEQMAIAAAALRAVGITAPNLALAAAAAAGTIDRLRAEQSAALDALQDVEGHSRDILRTLDAFTAAAT